MGQSSCGPSRVFRSWPLAFWRPIPGIGGGAVIHHLFSTCRGEGCCLLKRGGRAHEKCGGFRAAGQHRAGGRRMRGPFAVFPCSRHFLRATERHDKEHMPRRLPRARETRATMRPKKSGAVPSHCSGTSRCSQKGACMICFPPCFRFHERRRAESREPCIRVPVSYAQRDLAARNGTKAGRPFRRRPFRECPGRPPHRLAGSAGRR